MKVEAHVMIRLRSGGEVAFDADVLDPDDIDSLLVATLFRAVAEYLMEVET